MISQHLTVMVVYYSPDHSRSDILIEQDRIPSTIGT